ncbi:PH domain-containing protein [Salinirubrum litoreum]|uniref:PH domain-containing protein n=1 Tax=Salinirubrum litoreum TaxID=1126234 RepID=A0ABD5RG42_9EURY|nr:PH domain-containing protein [Salinirubrum litoreum]
MRPEHEWFTPEQLRRYYFAYEAVAVVVVLSVVGLLAVTGALAAMHPWVLAVGGGVLLLGFGYLTWWVPAFARTAEYRFTDDEVEYRRGVFFRQQTTVPYNRITNVGTAQGPIQRLVKSGAVKVHTAGFGGQTGAELTVDGVTDFQEIQEQILGRVRARPGTATEGDDVVEPTATADSPDESTELLGEIRRIRELLEHGRQA